MFVNNPLGGHGSTLRLLGSFSHAKVSRLCDAPNEYAGLFFYGTLTLMGPHSALVGRFGEAAK